METPLAKGFVKPTRSHTNTRKKVTRNISDLGEK
jgi:hypothetical protein